MNLFCLEPMDEFSPRRTVKPRQEKGPLESQSDVRQSLSSHLVSAPFCSVILSSVRSRAWDHIAHIKTQSQEVI